MCVCACELAAVRISDKPLRLRVLQVWQQVALSQRVGIPRSCACGLARTLTLGLALVNRQQRTTQPQPCGALASVLLAQNGGHTRLGATRCSGGSLLAIRGLACTPALFPELAAALVCSCPHRKRRAAGANRQTNVNNTY